MTKYMPFVYDEDKFITNQKCFILTGENLFFLTAFLNSSLFKYCYRENFPELQGGTRELSKVYFEDISVISISNEDELPIKNIVLEIQDKVKHDQNIKHLETEIEEIIFSLFNLKDKEKEKVRGFKFN